MANNRNNQKCNGKTGTPGTDNGKNSARNRGSNGNFRKSKKGSSKRKQHGDAKYEKREAGTASAYQSGSLNDLSWYARNPALLAAAGSFPFPYKPGMAIPLADGKFGTGPGSDLVDPKWTDEIPGVMAIQWYPSVGYSNDQTDPASIAAKEIFGKVREAFSGSIDADPPDFIIYLCALDGIFSAIGALKRIYRVLGTYSPYNYAVPDALLRALGIPEASIPTWLANKLDLFQKITELVGMTSKFRCPAVMDLFNRHYWLNDNIYMDSASETAQLYVFVQQEFGYYALQDIGESTYVGSVIGKPIDYSSVQSAYESVRAMINALAGSDDAYIISGYLTRAYSDAPVFAVAPPAIGEIATMTYSQEVLTQIENAKSVPFAMPLKFPAIRQNPKTNVVLCDPQTKPFAVTDLTGQILSNFNNVTLRSAINLRVPTPSAADNVIATRLVTMIREVESADNNYIMHLYSGTEVVQGFVIYAGSDGDFDPTNTWSSVYFADFRTGGGTPIGGYMPALFEAATFMQFDWAPIIQLYYLTGTTEAGVAQAKLLGDVDHLATISPETMNQLHRVCVYSEFNAFQLS